MAETLPGWSAPVYSGMAEPPMFKGVPLLFFVVNLLGTLFTAFFLTLIQPVYSVVVVLVGVGVYVVGNMATKIEPRWGRILRQYVAYASYYEG